MKRAARILGRFVLSSKPLSAGERARLAAASGETEFGDLGELSGGGWRRVRELRRSVRALEVVVAGSETELAVFGDVLSIVARLVPARSRRIVDAYDRSSSLPNLCASWARILLGTVRGLLALALNSWSAHAFFSGAIGRKPLEVPVRCLYLRPTLFFGEQVGGSVGHVAGVVNALARRGQSVKLVASSEQPLIDSGIMKEIVSPAFSSAFPNELNRHRFHRIFLRAALHAALPFKPSYLYVRYSLSDLTGPMLRREIRVPLILEYNGSEVWAQRHWGKPLLFETASRRIEEANLRAADLVVVVSEEIHRQVLSLGVPKQRVLFYPNCVDAEVFDPSRFDARARKEARGRVGLAPDATLHTFVGTFGRWHGTEILATAIRRLIYERRDWLVSRKVHFLFVGDGPLAPRVREILGKESGGSFVTLSGYQPQAETAALLAASDVLLSPHVPNPDDTRFFGSPTKLFEYMAMERPIVASDLEQIGMVLRGWRPAIPDAPPEEPAAVLVNPGDVDDLIRGILLVESLPAEKRREMARRARSFVLRAFTWDKNAEAVLESLAAVLREAEGPESASRPSKARAIARRRQ